MVTQIIVAVRLTVPPGMSPYDATDELRKGIEFGKPEIHLMYVLESDTEDTT